MPAPTIPTGCVNFRDLGGCATPAGPVRPGRVFRSASLADADPDDVAWLVEELGIRTVVDLRSDVEVEHSPLDGVSAAGITVHHVPLHDGVNVGHETFDWESSSMVDLYRLMLDACAPGFVAAARVVADDRGHPIVLQCAAGKDRTGLLAALLLGVAGAGDDAIIGDYTLSSGVADVLRERSRQRAAARRDEHEVPARFFRADGETMRVVLDELNATHGSCAAYLVAHGLEPDRVERLRDVLVGTPSG